MSFKYHLIQKQNLHFSPKSLIYFQEECRTAQSLSCREQARSVFNTLAKIEVELLLNLKHKYSYKDTVPEHYYTVGTYLQLSENTT